ncbi:unnamed protein product [Lota lota]
MNYCVWAILLVVLSLPWVDSAEETEKQFSVIRRLRRQINACQDGNHTVDGKTCCLCAAGQRLTKKCDVKPDDRECDFCEKGKTYNSKPTYEDFCEPCTSCAQPNANLEVKEECTTAKDAVCQCKEDYFCISETCTNCIPCEKCEGKTVKKPCTRTDDTVCDEKREGQATVVVISVIAILVLVTVAVAVTVAICWRKKLLCFKKSSDEMEIPGRYVKHSSQKQALLEKDWLDTDGAFPRLVPAIAEVVGWVEMKNIARMAGFKNTSIDNHMLNHPTDAKERTIELLLEWGEKHGREALRILVTKLNENNRIATVEELTGIFEKDKLSRIQPVSVP